MPDNFVQDPYNTQNFNRYGYVLNNPLMYVDQNGEFFFVAALIGAAIGAITQAIKPGANFGKILGGALIGAASGAIGAGVGNVVAGGAFFSSEVAVTIGFAQGFASGFAGGFAGGFIGAAGNSWLDGASFGAGLGAGLKGGLMGGAIGGVVNGTISGIRSVSEHKSFWSGAEKGVSDLNTEGAKAGLLGKALNRKPEPVVYAEGTYNDWVQAHQAEFSVTYRVTDWQRTILETSKTLQDLGDYLTYGGYALTTTGVGAGVGVPLSGVGGTVSLVGSGIEAYATQNYGQGIRSAGFYMTNRVGGKLISKIPGMTDWSTQILRQNLGIKFSLIEKGINQYPNSLMGTKN
ncbi:RHS repeat-associated core domain-containing protein [Sinomicrobium soli]|uniref:hypothetical protein n=1 Tax=Sinomicrobium sp. N-1-3-6 TaxID=2219864 RepID=UPI0011BE9671|nr:hypothetical protein [Sinomicrobium sp. N-1-3-6]